MEVAIFGAGIRGKEAYHYFKKRGDNVVTFIDNDCSMVGKTLFEIEILSLQEYLKKGLNTTIYVAASYKYAAEIIKQLQDRGISDYIYFNREDILKEGRLISYCTAQNLEDIVLSYKY